MNSIWLALVLAFACPLDDPLPPFLDQSTHVNCTIEGPFLTIVEDSRTHRVVGNEFTYTATARVEYRVETKREPWVKVLAKRTTDNAKKKWKARLRAEIDCNEWLDSVTEARLKGAHK